jgi:N,N'-diacetylchitobiose transport system substrate-binding protein
VKRKLAAAIGIAGMMVSVAACGGSDNKSSTSGTDAKELTVWLTVDAQNNWPNLVKAADAAVQKKHPGIKIKHEYYGWPDKNTKLDAVLATDKAPDVVEMGNTEMLGYMVKGAFAPLDASKFASSSAWLDGLKASVTYDGKTYGVPYYAGGRVGTWRKDIAAEVGVTAAPKTWAEYTAALDKIQAAKGDKFSALYQPSPDWYAAMSYVYDAGGAIAKKDGDKWKATLESEESLKGLQQLQDLYKNASKAPNDAKDSNQYIYLNDTDQTVDADGNKTGDTSLAAATIMAPGWAHWSIGDLGKGDDGKPTRTWNDATFGTFVLPGNDGKPAPVFAGGSNIGISAKTKEPGLSKTLMKIIFSKEYQEMLGKNGLGPANEKYTSSLGDDQFAKALIESASNSKLTPAAPGWASVEASNVMEEFFSKIRDAADLKALAQEYDKKIDALLNVKS